jgi:hypothetical protein
MEIFEYTATPTPLPNCGKYGNNISHSNRSNSPALRHVWRLTLVLLCVGMRHGIHYRQLPSKIVLEPGRGEVQYQETAADCIMRSFLVIRMSKSRSAVANLIGSSGLAEVYKIRHCTLPLDLASGPGSATATRTCCGGGGRTEGPTRFWWVTLKEKDHSHDVGVDGRITFKIYLKEKGGEGRAMDWSGLGQGQVAGSCEHEDGPSGTIKST